MNKILIITIADIYFYISIIVNRYGATHKEIIELITQAVDHILSNENLQITLKKENLLFVRNQPQCQQEVAKLLQVIRGLILGLFNKYQITTIFSNEENGYIYPYIFYKCTKDKLYLQSI